MKKFISLVFWFYFDVFTGFQPGTLHVYQGKPNLIFGIATLLLGNRCEADRFSSCGCLVAGYDLERFEMKRGIEWI